MPFFLSVGARDSKLSRAQVEEVEREFQIHYPEIKFKPHFIKTKGDLDKKTSLRSLSKCDFFTAEIDEAQLRGDFRLAIHSAKDLPSPLREGLTLAGLTKGLDPRDALVLKEGKRLEDLAPNSIIATSSERRELACKELRKDLSFIDLRGTIEERLILLTQGRVEGVVIAEAALIRLKLTHLNRIHLPGESAPLQGRLALIVRKEDQELSDFLAMFSSSHCKTNEGNRCNSTRDNINNCLRRVIALNNDSENNC